MRKLLLAASLLSTQAFADTVYLSTGESYELQPGEKVYVSSGVLWEFTVFQSDDIRLQQVEPVLVPAPDNCLTFGGGCAGDDEEEEQEEQEESDCGLTFGGGC